MFWVFVFIVVAAAVAYALTRQRNSAVAIQAEYERIKRNEPESSLAQLGPNEFEIGYKAAAKKQKQIEKRNGWKYMPFAFGALIVGSIVGAMIFGFEEEEGVKAFFLGFVCFAGTTIWAYRAAKNETPGILDVMREAA